MKTHSISRQKRNAAIATAILLIFALAFVGFFFFFIPKNGDIFGFYTKNFYLCT